jgi:hypothetical protein
VSSTRFLLQSATALCAVPGVDRIATPSRTGDAVAGSGERSAEEAAAIYGRPDAGWRSDHAVARRRITEPSAGRGVSPTLVVAEERPS